MLAIFFFVLWQICRHHPCFGTNAHSVMEAIKALVKRNGNVMYDVNQGVVGHEMSETRPR